MKKNIFDSKQKGMWKTKLLTENKKCIRKIKQKKIKWKTKILRGKQIFM